MIPELGLFYLMMIEILDRRNYVNYRISSIYYVEKLLRYHFKGSCIVSHSIISLPNKKLQRFLNLMGLQIVITEIKRHCP